MSKITDIKSFLKIKELIGQKYNKTDQNTKKKNRKEKKGEKNPPKNSTIDQHTKEKENKKIKKSWLQKLKNWSKYKKNNCLTANPEHFSTLILKVIH